MIFSLLLILNGTIGPLYPIRERYGCKGGIPGREEGNPGCPLEKSGEALVRLLLLGVK
jgi:hypothetical protein